MSDPKAEVKVVVTKNGPYLVTGSVPMSEQTIAAAGNGDSEAWQESHPYPAQASYALCRCGQSKTKPFCDGAHKKAGFNGTETASRTTPFTGPRRTTLISGTARPAALCATVC